MAWDREEGVGWLCTLLAKGVCVVKGSPFCVKVSWGRGKYVLEEAWRQVDLTFNSQPLSSVSE